MKSSRIGAYIAGLSYASIFGFSFLMTKGALEAFRPLELLFLRFSLATAVLGILGLLKIVRLDYRGKPIMRLLPVCLFQPVLYFLSETYGVARSATSTAGIVLGALPATVGALGTVMLGERLGKLRKLSLGLSVLGVAVIALWGSSSAGDGEGTVSGFLLLLGALASATFYNMYSKRASERFTPFETTFVMMLAGTLVFGAAALAQGWLDPQATSLLARVSGENLASILYLGILSSIVAFFCLNYTLARLKASQSAVFANLITLITVAAGVLIRGEAFGLPELIGGLLILAGVYGANSRFAGR